MAKTADLAREWGVVGAGGAGFPTHVKLSARAEVFAVNAAECEPLLYKDQTILEEFTAPFMEGMAACTRSVGAERSLVGVKKSHGALIDLLLREGPPGLEVVPLEDAYPSGDEHILVHETTGRVIPKGGLPLDVGVVVNNVETVLNVGLARPVTHKFLTVSGAVPEASTLRVPLGAPLEAVLRAAGAPTRDAAFIVNGPMMGHVVEDLSLPVTKTTSGILVLPPDHPLVAKKSRPFGVVRKIAFSCDQCMRCTDLCPRDLLGHGVKPHKAMISVAFSPVEAYSWQETALYCCECALCSYYACPEDLDPFRVMVESKRALLARGIRPSKEAVVPLALLDYRRTPTELLIQRLGLEPYVGNHRYLDTDVAPKMLRLPLKQHTGAPSLPTVREGETVQAGALIADIPEKALGARLFAPRAGRVGSVGPDEIILEVS